MANRAFMTAAGLLFLSASAVAKEDLSACAGSPLRVGACFTVHGRLTTCTGVPNARIWVVGTKRILGVVSAEDHPGGDPLLPGWLDEVMFSATPCAKAAYGDFTVCPLTPDRPGIMQRVCMTGAAKVTVRDW